MAFNRSLWLVTVALIGLALPVQGCAGKQAVSGSTMSTASNAPDLSWVPPADGFDWIQLKSGE